MLVFILLFLLVLFFTFYRLKKKSVFKRKTIKLKQFQPISNARNRTKPDWVIDKVIYLKALMPNCGCGTVAMTFNRLYSEEGETVSKTFVYEKLKNNAYQVKCKRRDIKSRQPKASAINQTWGIDLTTVTICGKKQLILGIVDHGSRALLCLQSINSKHSILIIRELISIIKKCGFPKKIRTDNEVCFTHLLFGSLLLYLE